MERKRKNINMEKNNFTVFHFDKKGKSGYGYIGKLDKHIMRDPSSRKSFYGNIDKERMHLNQDILGDGNEFQKMKITDAIEKRIEDGYKKKTAIRKDAVRFFTLHLSASHEIAWDIYNDSAKRQKWIEANKKWVFDTFGEENIIRFVMHVDEKTPHFHVVGVPITKDGNLSMSQFVDGRKDLKKLHTIYAEYMKPFGLRRGIENVRNKPTTVERFRGQIVEKQQEVLAETRTEASKKILTKRKIGVFEEALKGFVSENERLVGVNSRLKHKVDGLSAAVETRNVIIDNHKENIETHKKILKKMAAAYDQYMTKGMNEAELEVFNDFRIEVNRWLFKEDYSKDNDKNKGRDNGMER